MELKAILRGALLDSVAETFASILSVIPSVKDSSGVLDINEKNCVVASIGLAGTLEGSLTLIFSGQVACKMVSRMLSSELTEITQDVLDGSGEMVNILAGGIKTRLDNTGYSFELSIPSVLHLNDSMEIARLQHTEVMHLAVSAGELVFSIILSFAIKKDRDKEAGHFEVKRKQDASQSLRDIIKP